MQIRRQDGIRWLLEDEELGNAGTYFDAPVLRNMTGATAFHWTRSMYTYYVQCPRTFH